MLKTHLRKCSYLLILGLVGLYLLLGNSAGLAAGDADAGKSDSTTPAASQDTKAPDKDKAQDKDKDKKDKKTAKPTKPAKPAEDKYWLAAKEEVARTVLELLAQHREETEKGCKYHKLIRGNKEEKIVALTFDDGPHPKTTPALLALLKKCQVKATFFVVGEMAAKYPNLIKAEIADGHNVGNHTYHHVNLTKIPDPLIPVEIKACGSVLKSITGKPAHLFRPPGGRYNRDVADAAEVLGYTTVLWTDNPGDYEKPTKEIIQDRLLKNITPGSVILLHDGIPETMQALPEVISILKSKGYQFVTIDEMIQRTKNIETTDVGGAPPIKSNSTK